MDLYEAGFDTHWLELAEQLQNTADRIFWDTENAGYFSTANNDTWILVRHKDGENILIEQHLFNVPTPFAVEFS